jgi:hypothetical protein
MAEAATLLDVFPIAIRLLLMSLQQRGYGSLRFDIFVVYASFNILFSVWEYYR